MFLSTENPSLHDPLPSPNSPSSFTTSSHELGQTHLQNFSIRDYAYSNRKNNIKNNWPFSPKSLQLCSSYGVTDPLPPFETTDSSSSVKQIVSHVHKGGISQSRIVKNGFGRSTSVSKAKKVEIVVVAGTSTNNNKDNKKCGRGGMLRSKEDTCGGGGGGLVMTTTCPICKTFSSASNTTLNAHIDQCLSVDSELPQVSRTKTNKAKVKPLMKVKTLVDIYASAKRCTLEDLDKRNGTKWVSILSGTDQVVADKVSKKRKVSPVGIGPVYIDAKGQKLRILTELSEKKTSTTTTTLREQHEDGSKESRKSWRKRLQGKKHYKYLKQTNLKAKMSEIHECQRVFSREGSSKGHRRIYNQRMLSTCGLISKKLNEKEHKSYALRDQSSDDDDDDDSWSGEEHLVFRGTDSSPLNKQKLQREVPGRIKTMFGNKKEEKPLARTHLDTVQLKKRLASIQEDKYSLGKNVRELSPPATSMRKLSAPFVANGWRRLSLPVEPKKARLDWSEEEEETGKWESEMTHEREPSDDDYVSSDDSPSFSRYDDDDEEEEDDNNNKRANVLDKSNDATPSNETIPSERTMYYSEEVGDMVYEQPICDEEMRFGSEVRGKGSLFVEVDTIPIPGPPGSFLPSPRDMCYDENLGNSSVITSQIQSLDRNSSESPVSNFAAGKLSFPTELSPSYSTTPMSFCGPSLHETITEAELMNIDKTEPPRFRNNDDESCCCCQRKERISEGIALNHQTSHLLQRRATAYSSTAMNLTNLNHPYEQSSPYMMIQQDLDLQSKSSNRSVVPPSPKPVLRLMGKDLLVMNQGEAEASQASLKPTPQFVDPHPCAGTGLYFNTGIYLSNSFESTHQPQTPKAQTQTQTQASQFRNNFDHGRHLSPS